MSVNSNWLSGEDASRILRVAEKKLDFYREKGYLKPGYHWRSSPDPNQIPWNPKVFYCISQCKEILDYLQDNDPYLAQIAA